MSPVLLKKMFRLNVIVLFEEYISLAISAHSYKVSKSL